MYVPGHMTIFYTENLTRKVDLRYISTSKISLKNATKLFKSGFWHVERILHGCKKTR